MLNFLSVVSETFYVEATVKYRAAAHKTGSVLMDVRLRCVRAVQKLEGLHILSVSVVLIIQHSMHMRRIRLSSVACLTLHYFQHYFINGKTSEYSYWT
jgi:hypothetical protein